MTTYEVHKAAEGSSRWHVLELREHSYPARRLVLKCPTKRCATALAEILTSRTVTRELVEVVLAAELKAASKLALTHPRTFAVDQLAHVLGRADVAPPAWWGEFVAEYLATEKPTKITYQP